MREGCRCGELLDAEGTRSAVIDACAHFRAQHHACPDGESSGCGEVPGCDGFCCGAPPHRLPADSDRLDHLTVLVEDIRNLLATLTSAAPGAAMPPAAATESPGLTVDDFLSAVTAARLWSKQSTHEDFWRGVADKFMAAAKAMK